MESSIIQINNKKYRLEWHKDINFDKLDNIRQVYGYIFDNKGRLVIVNPKATWRLPGGHPEKKDKTFEETLIRESDEEADVEITGITPLGYIKVTPLDKSEKINYLLRYVARIKTVKKQTVDIAEGIINDRKFINVKDFSKYCDWGEMGEKILSEAVILNKNE
jgi:8-oxo-dGTP pyrophosphatase MutT (NUDIX family)